MSENLGGFRMGGEPTPTSPETYIINCRLDHFVADETVNWNVEAQITETSDPYFFFPLVITDTLIGQHGWVYKMDSPDEDGSLMPWPDGNGIQTHKSTGIKDGPYDWVATAMYFLRDNELAALTNGKHYLLRYRQRLGTSQTDYGGWNVSVISV